MISCCVYFYVVHHFSDYFVAFVCRCSTAKHGRSSKYVRNTANGNMLNLQHPGWMVHRATTSDHSQPQGCRIYHQHHHAAHYGNWCACSSTHHVICACSQHPALWWGPDFWYRLLLSTHVHTTWDSQPGTSGIQGLPNRRRRARCVACVHTLLCWECFLLACIAVQPPRTDEAVEQGDPRLINVQQGGRRDKAVEALMEPAVQKKK